MYLSISLFVSESLSFSHFSDYFSNCFTLCFSKTSIFTLYPLGFDDHLHFNFPSSSLKEKQHSFSCELHYNVHSDRIEDLFVDIMGTNSITWKDTANPIHLLRSIIDTNPSIGDIPDNAVKAVIAKWARSAKLKQCGVVDPNKFIEM